MKQSRIGFRLVIVVLIVAITILLLPYSLFSEADSGGTDPDIEVEGVAGDNGFEWNQTHGFVLRESGNIVEEEFNITICEDVRFSSTESKYVPNGHIFGELHHIRWNDDPEHNITISLDDFEEYKEDSLNLTVYILGEYYREDPHGGEDELRQAYRNIIVQRPNHPPVAVAMITDSDESGNGNWGGWKNASDPKDLNENGELSYYISSEEIRILFYFNASDSWDPDGDEITEWYWDLDGDNEFGKYSSERKKNTTVYLGEGDYLLGLMVGDGNNRSRVLDIKVNISVLQTMPDLIITDVFVINMNGENEFRKGEMANVLACIKNIGSTEISDSFDVSIEYTTDTGDDYTELGSITITELMDINQMELVEFLWDTGSEEFDPANYSFRATVDIDGRVEELNEDNNTIESEIIILLPSEGDGEPEISIKEVQLSKTEARVNEIIWMNITLKNTGDGNASFVDIFYYIDNVFQYYRTVTKLEKNGGEETLNFVFSRDSSSSYRVKFEVKDNGITVATSDSYSFGVPPHHFPTHPEDSEPPDLTIISPKNNVEIKGIITLLGTASDNIVILEVEYRVGTTGEWQKALGTTLWTVELDTKQLEDGEQTIQFRAYDSKQYSVVKTITLEVRNDDNNGGSGGITGFELTALVGAMVIAILLSSRNKAKGSMSNQMKEMWLLIPLIILIFSIIVLFHASYESSAISPEPDYIITPYFDASEAINDTNDFEENGVIDVFYSDKIFLRQRAFDADGDLLTFQWEFKCNETTLTTEATGDVVYGEVGVDFLYEDLSDSDPIKPLPNSDPVDYEAKIIVSDGDSIVEKSNTIRVHPYAEAEFVKQVKLGTSNPDATVTLTWRGFPFEAASGIQNISPSKPVFVHIDPTDSPDPNLHNGGSIGLVYDIRSVGCRLQNGDEGFVEAEISIPILTSDLDTLGDSFAIEGDLKLEVWDGIEKRFIAVEGSHVETHGGVKYVVGSVDHFSIYTVIVDSIYNPANPHYDDMLPDLSVENIVFSRYPVPPGQGVEVTAYIKNSGKTSARNVDVKIYDGADLVGDQRIDLINANGSEFKVKEHFQLLPYSELSYIKVFVNKQHAITEKDYENNEKQGVLVQGPTPVLQNNDLSLIHGISPLDPKDGDKVKITMILMNIGGSQAENITVQVLVNDQLMETSNIETLVPDELITKSWNWTAQEGNHTITIKLTCLDYTAQTNEEIMVFKKDNKNGNESLHVIIGIGVILIIVGCGIGIFARRQNHSDTIESLSHSLPPSPLPSSPLSLPPSSTPPSPPSPVQTVQRIAAEFPIIEKCPGCSTNLKIRNPGRVTCPMCKEEFVMNEQRTIREDTIKAGGEEEE